MADGGLFERCARVVRSDEAQDQRGLLNDHPRSNNGLGKHKFRIRI